MVASGEIVLVVDDDAEIRDTLTHLLEAEGYTVLGAANGIEALAQLRGGHPNVMLLDLMMPIMSGWEVLEELKESGELADVSVVVVSAMCAPGVRACLQKPVDLDELLATIERCCHAPIPPAPSAAHP